MAVLHLSLAVSGFSDPSLNREYKMKKILLLVSLLACSGEESPTPTSPPTNNDGPIIIELSGFSFSQPNITIDVGTTIRWVNTNSAFHTVTPDGHTQWQRATSGSPGTVVEVTFNSPGVFNYFCEPHRGLGMFGKVTVR